jgi:transcriptional regulator with XRE-family HTH domain
MTFGDELCRLLAERGMSQRELARRSHYDSGYINKLVRGVKQATPAVAERLDEVLDAGGALMALVNRRKVLTGAATIASAALLGALDADGRERLTWAQRHPGRVDQAAIDSLAGVLAAQRRAEDALGSAAMVKPVTAQLAAVDGLLSETRGPVRPAMADVAMQWSQFAAWLHMSARDFPAARALWRQTLELAAETDDATMTATALTRRAEMAWLSGEPGTMTGLAQAAQRDQRAAASERAHSAGIEARAYVMTGDVAAAERKLGEAADLAAEFADQPSGQQRAWSYWYKPQWFDCERGVTLGYLAHIDRYRVQALDSLTAGYAGLGDAASSEWAVDYVLRRAAIHVRGGDVEAACADAVQVVPVARQTDSANLLGMLAQLHTGMAARWPDDPRVADLADALR